MIDEAERKRILAEARQHVADVRSGHFSLATERPAFSVEDLARDIRRREYEPQPEERAQPEREVRHSQPIQREAQDEPQGWDAWNAWADGRIRAAIEAEREFLLSVLGETIAELMRRQLHTDREKGKREAKAEFETELQALRIEVSNLEATLAELGKIIASERARVVDAPSLRSMRDMN